MNNDKPLILAVETSGRAGSAAVGIADKMLAETAFSGLLRHNAELFPTIKTLLERIKKKPDQIDEVYITAGPGSFTGIRIAVTLAKMLALSCGAKIVAPSTMDVISVNADEYMHENNKKINKIATIIDAKRKQFYIAIFERKENIWVKTVPDCLLTAPDFLARFGNSDEPIWLLGEGLVYYSDAFKAPALKLLDKKYWHARARGVYKTGRIMAKNDLFTPPQTLIPHYIRRPEAIENLEKRPSKHK